MNLKKLTNYMLITAVVLLASAGPVRSDELQSAYQKEYAYLEEQQRNLVSRLAAFKAKSSAERKGLMAEVDVLSNRYRRKQNEAKNLNDIVFESERTLESARDNKNIFSSTFDQAEETLKAYSADTKINESTAADKKVGLLFARAFDVLEDVRSVRKEKGSFFTQKGEKVNGEILRIGEIASYGMSETARGILVPAGAGEFKLWQKPAVSVTDDLFTGRHPEQLDIFLYENRLNAVNASAEKNVSEYISSGGMVGWIIVMLGVLALVLVAFRAAFLRSASSASEKILTGIRSYIVDHDIAGAMDLCKKFKGSTSRVVSATLRNLDRDRDHLEDIVAESILHESPVLNRFGALIIVIAAVTPLLGLLGTVTGMISTFDIITEFGTGDPKLLSGGISVALVTTQLGLIVAIPALILGNLLSGWSNRIKDDMEKAALNVINIYDAPQLAK